MENALYIVNILKAKGFTISAAESCTGGLFAKTITDCPGASAVLNESYVTYSPKAKMRLLGVKSETISKYSVVSREVAKEMAEGVRNTASADIGVSFTGYAGPDGDEVGLVYAGIATKTETIVKKLTLQGSREEIRQGAVEAVLKELKSIV